MTTATRNAINRIHQIVEADAAMADAEAATVRRLVDVCRRLLDAKSRGLVTGVWANLDRLHVALPGCDRRLLLPTIEVAEAFCESLGRPRLVRARRAA